MKSFYSVSHDCLLNELHSVGIAGTEYGSSFKLICNITTNVSKLEAHSQIYTMFYHGCLKSVS